MASIKPFKDERVAGAIYEVSEKHLRDMDKFEAGYNRINVTVFTQDDEPVKAVTYIKIEQSEETKPSPEYLAVIQKGYKEWSLV